MAGNIAESWNLHRNKNQSQNRLRTTIVLLCLLLAGYMGNYFKIPIILHIDWLFGSIFTMLVVRLYGLGWGTLAAVISSSYTIVLWHHPSAFILYTLEAIFVGWGLRRRSSNLLLLDVFYWGIIGFPLLWFLYIFVANIPPQSVLFISFKNPLNQICNALIASLILTHTPIAQWFSIKKIKTHAFEQTILNLLVAFVLLPAMVLTIWNCQDATSAQENNVLVRLEDTRKNVSSDLHNWYHHNQEKLQALASNIQDSYPFRNRSNRSQLQEIIQIAQQTIPDFRNLYITDTDGQILNSTTVENANQNFTQLNSLPFQALFTAKQPMLSEMMMISNSPTIFQSIPIWQDDNLVGQFVAEIDVSALKKTWLSSQSTSTQLVSLLDIQDRVITTTRDELKVGQTFDRDRNGEIYQLDQNSYLWVPSIPNMAKVRLWRKSFYVHKITIGDELPWIVAIETPTASHLVKGEKRKILIIDDRWENRSVLINLLEPIGFEIIEANNGKEGIEQVLKTSPDLIITDLSMPVMNGFDFLYKLRSGTDSEGVFHPQLQNQTVLVSSASVFDVERHKSLDAGGNDFLPKPVQAETLLELLQKYLQLDWIYDTNNTKKQNVEVAADEIQPPETEILQQLWELAQDGELDGIIEIAEQLQDTNTAAFTQELTSLAEACEIQQLRTFIQHYLT